MSQVFNFSAGPAMLPIEVMHQAKQEFCNWHGLGTSVMEISHRSKYFMQVAEEAEQDCYDLLNVPANYKVLFCHGGARTHFAAVPMNILRTNNLADYINGGYWGYNAFLEAKKYCNTKEIDVKIRIDGLRGIKPMKKWVLSSDATYMHFCPNETIDGIAIHETPDFNDKIIAADFSSTILSRPININRYGIIYASAQKNIGPSGLTLVIIREDLLGQSHKALPSVLNYKILAENKSMFNTPPTFAWYLSGLVFKWLKEKGGLNQIHNINQTKANLLYQSIDNSTFYKNDVAKSNRSLMNVTFKLPNVVLEQLFIQESFSAGLHALKGHRIVGGIRASIYNAMPLKGVKALTEFMEDFERRYG